MFNKKKSIISINLEIFSLEKNDIQLKILSNCLKHVSKNYYPPRAKKILYLMSRIRGEKEIKATLGGCIIKKRQNNLIISYEKLKKSIKL